jgi:hypothetical protein
MWGALAFSIRYSNVLVEPIQKVCPSVAKAVSLMGGLAVFGAGTSVSLYTPHFDAIALNEENPHTPEQNDTVAPFIIALQSVG